MNNKDYELAKEVLDNIISKSIDDDINYGKELLSKCNKKLESCPIKDYANIYMNNMERKYGIFNKMYNIANGHIGNTSTSTVSKCYWLETQIWVIEKIKEVKKYKDDVDKVNKLIELLKEESK